MDLERLPPGDKHRNMHKPPRELPPQLFDKLLLEFEYLRRRAMADKRNVLFPVRKLFYSAAQRIEVHPKTEQLRRL